MSGRIEIRQRIVDDMTVDGPTLVTTEHWIGKPRMNFIGRTANGRLVWSVLAGLLTGTSKRIMLTPEEFWGRP